MSVARVVPQDSEWTPGRWNAVPTHAPAEEYEAFVRGHLWSRASGDHYMRAYRNFVEVYPDLMDWFRAPLPERVGRLYVPGSGGRMEPQRGPMTSRISYLARSYLFYLAMRGYASFDPEWLVAVPRMHPWKLLDHVGLLGSVNGLLGEAVSLGYCPESARQGLKWTILDLHRFRGLFQTEINNSARKGEHCHEQTRPTHRSFAEKLSG